jgi:hypothetical protein
VETGPLGDQVVPSCVERLGIWGYCWRYLVHTLLLLHRKNKAASLSLFLPLDVRPLKAAYSW